MRRDSMTGILLELSLSTFDTVIHNSLIIFANQVTMSSNNIVQWFLADRTNGRAIAIHCCVCRRRRRLSSVCDVMYCG